MLAIGGKSGVRLLSVGSSAIERAVQASPSHLLYIAALVVKDAQRLGSRASGGCTCGSHRAPYFQAQTLGIGSFFNVVLELFMIFKCDEV